MLLPNDKDFLSFCSNLKKLIKDANAKVFLDILKKDYYISFNGGMLSLFSKNIHISKKQEDKDEM